jgi:hypothetical protein
LIEASKAKLLTMIEGALVDAYAEYEQAGSWFTVLERKTSVAVFETTVLGVDVTVVRLELRDGGTIVAVCTRGRERQAIALADLPLVQELPGAEWIEACRRWLTGR